jgi:hypothetical protein
VIHRLWRSGKRQDLVSPSRVRALAAEVIGADLPDFARVEDGRYVKQIDADIAHVLKLKELKGAQYSLAWGVSLAYVPDKASLPLRFHGTLERARLDLWQDSHLRAGEQAPPSELASGLHGEDILRSGLTSMWRSALPLAQTWWEAASTLDGILGVSEEQVRLERPGEAHHDPPPQLIRVLTMARLGHSADVESGLGALAGQLEADEIQAIVVAADRAARQRDGRRDE